MKIGPKLSLGLARVLAMMVMLVGVSILGLNSLRSAIKRANNLQRQTLAPLYATRQALDQTSIAARNAYVLWPHGQCELLTSDELRPRGPGNDINQVWA